MSEAGTAAAVSSPLTLREQLRLKAQQKLSEQASTSASAGRKPATSSAALAIDDDDDDDALGSLTLGRSKRQAALKRPATYSIDPTDDASRLHRHPDALAGSVAHHASSSKKYASVDGMLRERQRKIKRGIDADGFSRAEAIARSMEQERLGRMGIAYSDDEELTDIRIPGTSKAGTSSSRPKSSASFESSRQAGPSGSRTNGHAPEPTVQALSPTIPSFVWSSQSELGDSEDEDKRPSAATPTPDIQKKRLAASLAAVGADEDQSREALDILQRDMRDETFRPADPHGGRIPFYRPGKTVAPVIEAFCEVPNLGVADDAADTASTTRERIWTATYPHILLACAIPPSLQVRPAELARIVTWTAVTCLLERDVLQSQLAFGLLESLVLQPDQSAYRNELLGAVAQAAGDVLALVPRVLHRIGVSESVLVECFPDDADATDGPFFVVTRARPRTHDRAPSSSQTAKVEQARRAPRSALYLTHAECDELLAHLARVVQLVVQANSSAVRDGVSLLAGWVASMALACAAGTSVALDAAMGQGMEVVFAAAAETAVLEELQEAVARRLFTALEPESVVVRARVVQALPGAGRGVQALRAWLGWCVLTEHLASPAKVDAVVPVAEPDAVPSSDPIEAEGEADAAAARLRRDSAYWRRARFEAWSLDLHLLSRAVDANDPKSPFHVASSNADDSDADLSRLIAAVHLLALVLRDLPVHLCNFTHDARTPTKSDPLGQRSSASLPRALSLALAAYASVNPTLDEGRVQEVRTIVTRLDQANARIRDSRADVILRTLAKDALHRTSLALEYQLALYHPDSSPSFIQ
ncbi:hypothetical protein L1887_54962 [Cichorium endivia]|nr:hypothetical protein L1887_54962 [Cichorium endivia]